MVSAHEVFRIIGTIVKFENWRLDVKTADGEIFLIQLQEYTPIERDKKRHRERAESWRCRRRRCRGRYTVRRRPICRQRDGGALQHCRTPEVAPAKHQNPHPS